MKRKPKRAPRKTRKKRGRTLSARRRSDVRPIPDAVFARLAAIAGVPEDRLKSLRSLVLSAQAEAFRRHSVGYRKHLTIKDVRPHFTKLRKALEAMQRERNGQFAGDVLQAVIAPKTLEELLDALAKAERHAERMLPGRGTPKGPRGDTGFRQFTQQMVFCLKMLGDEPTCERMSGPDYDKIKGSYADVLELLRDYLPERFIPKSAHAIATTFDLANKSAI